MDVPPVKIVFDEEMRREALARIDKAMATGQVASGSNIKEWEETFAKTVGVKHAIAVSSGGSALEALMVALKVEGKEVLVPTNTFLATASSVIRAGGTVKFVDCAADTFSPSLAQLKAAKTAKTAGVALVHIGGIISKEIEAIRSWCDQQGLWLVEDAAHGHGSAFGGKNAGQFGLAGAYSFFATKTMTSGEGGMVVTNDDSLAKLIVGLRDYGKPEPYVSYYTMIGANWRMSEFNAAVGIVQYKKLPQFVAWRERTASQYSAMLDERPIDGLSTVLPQDKSSWYKYIVLLPKGIDREKVRAGMRNRGVRLSGGVYDQPLHQQPVFSGVKDSFPVADDVCARHVCLPLYYGMSDDEARFVVDTLQTVVSEVRHG